MKSADVEIGAVYSAKVSGNVVPVKIVGKAQLKGWVAQNLKTHRLIHIRSPQRLRRQLTPQGAVCFTVDRPKDDHEERVRRENIRRDLGLNC